MTANSSIRFPYTSHVIHYRCPFRLIYSVVWTAGGQRSEFVNGPKTDWERNFAAAGTTKDELPPTLLPSVRFSGKPSSVGNRGENG